MSNSYHCFDQHVDFFNATGLKKYQLYIYMACTNQTTTAPDILSSNWDLPIKSPIDISYKYAYHDMCHHYEKIIVKYYSHPHFYRHCVPFLMHHKTIDIQKQYDLYPYTATANIIRNLRRQISPDETIWQFPLCVGILTCTVFNVNTSESEVFGPLLEVFINDMPKNQSMLEWILFNACDLHNNKKTILTVIYILLKYNKFDLIDEIIDRYLSADEFENYVNFIYSLDNEKPNVKLTIYLYTRGYIIINKPIYNRFEFTINLEKDFNLNQEDAAYIKSVLVS
jgi:hypothetical protein